MGVRTSKLVINIDCMAFIKKNPANLSCFVDLGISIPFNLPKYQYYVAANIPQYARPQCAISTLFLIKLDLSQLLDMVANSSGFGDCNMALRKFLCSGPNPAPYIFMILINIL